MGLGIAGDRTWGGTSKGSRERDVPNVPCWVVPPGTRPYHTVHAIPFMPYHNTLGYHTYPTTVQNRTVPYFTIPCHALPHTMPYHTLLYHTIPYRFTPYHTTSYQTIPYHTVPYHTPDQPIRNEIGYLKLATRVVGHSELWPTWQRWWLADDSGNYSGFQWSGVCQYTGIFNWCPQFLLSRHVRHGTFLDPVRQGVKVVSPDMFALTGVPISCRV